MLLTVTTASYAQDSKVVTGSLAGRYHFRTTGGEQDHDIETIATLNFGDSNKHRFTGAIQGGGLFDLNGDNAAYFSNIYNTFSNSSVGRLYYAYMDVNRFGPVNQLRIGRQHKYSLDSLYFDGASLETHTYSGFTLGAFGGVPVHQFESQLGFDYGDWVAGGSLQWRPIAIMQFKFDITYLRDKLTGFRVAAGDQSDTLMGGSVWIDVVKWLHVYSRVTAFTDQMRDFEIGATVKLPDQDLRFRLSGYRLLNGYAIRVLEWDVFGVAGTYVPYT
ncbi:hypothetical protein KJ708_08135, partial [bacterium]|nr:hypothetical protein [bacterium]MBU1919175.1 hypothetical protein [bacterium]